MLKILGLDRIQAQLQDAQKALEELHGEIGTATFNPHDPASIEAAIQEVGRLIDERVGRYATNSIIGPLAEAMKEEFRQGMLDKAAEARLQSGEA